jgi:electron transfer flavoprotein beta subunit
MSAGFHVVVCGSLVPDPLQTLEPVTGPDGPGLRNEAMLPSVLDPWAAHALYEAADLARRIEGSRVWLVSLGPRAKLQQLMMTIAQKVPFELVALDGPAGGFVDAHGVAAALAEAIRTIPDLDPSRLLLFGGCASASRDAGVTLAMTGDALGVRDQFLAVDALAVEDDGALRIKERVEGGRYLVSLCAGPPAVLAWATGSLPEPPSSPQVGMANMRTILPALQRARSCAPDPAAVTYHDVSLPVTRRETRIVKDLDADAVARELVDWITEGGR